VGKKRTLPTLPKISSYLKIYGSVLKPDRFLEVIYLNIYMSFDNGF